METLQRTANRGSVSTGYDIDNSLKLEPDNSEFLSITNTSDGSKRTATYSFWLKRTELEPSTWMQVAGLYNTGETVRFMFYQDHIMLENGWGGTQKRLTTNAVYRDTSSFYHFVVGIDTTQSTASNRVKLYVNGVQETSFSTEQYPDQDFDLAIGRSGANYPWRYGAYDATYYGTAGYLAEAHYIDGTQYAASDFGEFDEDSGIWKPKEFTGNYGTQGSYLNFSDASNLGANSKGSDIDAVLTNITAADQATDTPTNNFCTLNILYNYAYGNTITEGATKIYGAANNWGGGKATFGLTSGKWYWEIKQLANGNTFMGLQTDGEDNISSGNAQSQNTSVVFYTDGTLQYSNGSESTTSASNSIAANSIVGFALDLDSATQTIKVYNNNSLVTAFGSSGTANLSTYNIADKTVFPFVALYDRTVNMNFGGYTVSSISSAASDENGYGTFEYAPPSGYYAICTKNLAEFG